MASSLANLKKYDVYVYYTLVAGEALYRGDIRRASVYGDMALKQNDEIGHPLANAHNCLLKAQIMLELREYGKACEYLDQAFHLAQKIQAHYLEFSCLLTGAYFSFCRGDEEKGLEYLRKALVIGREQGCYLPFIWLPAVMPRLCTKALAAGIEKEYVKEFIHRYNFAPPNTTGDMNNWPYPLKVYILGRFRVLKDDQPLDYGQKAWQKPMDLLKALISSGEKEVDIWQLIDAFWPEVDGDASHHAFETTLYRLRKLLGKTDILILKNNRLTLDLRYCWVDAWAFEELLETAETLGKGNSQAEQTNIKEAMSLTGKALQLYQGPFLGHTEQSWSISFRERLHAKFIRHTIRLGRYWEETGQWDRAVECYQKALEVDDLVEEFYLRLMNCYHKIGQKSEVIRIYDRCRKTLSVALGIELSPEIQALYKRILLI